jgi:hypothetical protein
MEEQSSGEFASANAAAGVQDAAVQEPGFSPEIPVNACRRLQDLQRPTPSHLSPNPPRASRCGDGHMADRRRSSSLKIPEPPTLHACPHGNVTIPFEPLFIESGTLVPAFSKIEATADNLIFRQRFWMRLVVEFREFSFGDVSQYSKFKIRSHLRPA